jgi:hypothetical protein
VSLSRAADLKRARPPSPLTIMANVALRTGSIDFAQVSNHVTAATKGLSKKGG